MPHYLPSDFEIDTDTRTVTHKASGRRYSWDRSFRDGQRDPLPSQRGGAYGYFSRNSHDLIRYGFKALREAEYAAGRS